MAENDRSLITLLTSNVYETFINGYKLGYVLKSIEFFISLLPILISR